MSELRIDRRFCGPPGAANGGYVSGCVARVLEGPAEVTLRAPTPLETTLVLDRHGSRASLHSVDGALLVEAASLARVDVELPEPVSFEAAQEASSRYVGFENHPYPGCFVCGPARPAELGPGFSLFPGAVADARRVAAAPFIPPTDLCDEQGLLPSELVWAALDCPSWFGHAAFYPTTNPILLGRLAVEVKRRPKALERCVVHGFPIGQEGRRIFCGSALRGADGAWIAYARATWVELKSA